MRVVQQVFRRGELPDDMAELEQLWIWKNKGDPESCSQYRGLSLEEHALKAASPIGKEPRFFIRCLK